MKNEVFNGPRFWAYFKYDFIQMWRNHVKAAVGIGLAGLIWYFIYVIFHLVLEGTWSGPGLVSRFIVFTLAVAVLELYQTRTYGYLTDKKKGSAWLMIPASTFEKWVSMMLMTLVLLPVLFLCSSFLVDGLICLLDPTVSQPMYSVITDGFQELNQELLELNTSYMTTWNLGMIGLPALVGFWCSLLFFLLCGLCFRKNKILSAFAILFLFSVATSLVTGAVTLNHVEDFEDFATAEEAIRTVINWSTAISAVIDIALAGGIYYRLKTLKH